MRGKGLDDSQTAAAVGLKDQGKLYLKVSLLSILLAFASVNNKSISSLIKIN